METLFYLTTVTSHFLSACVQNPAHSPTVSVHCLQSFCWQNNVCKWGIVLPHWPGVTFFLVGEVKGQSV